MPLPDPTPPAPGTAPRDVFAAACAALAAYGHEHGFVYRKSRRVLVRQRDQWIDEIHLQTLTSNAPEHVALLVWIAAHHKGLEHWRASRPERSSLRGFVLRSSLGYLTPLAQQVEWNVAPRNFRAALVEVTCLLDDFGLPFFDALGDPVSMVEAALKAGYEPTFVEYLVSEGLIHLLAEFLEALELQRPPLFDTERRRMAQLAAGAPLELERAAFVRIADVLVANDLGHLLAPAAAVDERSPADSPLEGELIMSTADLQAELRRWGEDEVADALPDLDEAALRRQQVLGSRHANTGMLLGKAAALATVEVVEGAPRPLRRSRRKPLP